MDRTKAQELAQQLLALHEVLRAKPVPKAADFGRACELLEEALPYAEDGWANILRDGEAAFGAIATDFDEERFARLNNGAFIEPHDVLMYVAAQSVKDIGDGLRDGKPAYSYIGVTELVRGMEDLTRLVEAYCADHGFAPRLVA